jgi:hypothetical protein
VTEEHIEVVTYSSANAKPHERWLAFVLINGKQWLVRFSGPDEASTAERARNFYKAEKERQTRLCGDDAPSPVTVREKASIIVSGGAGVNKTAPADGFKSDWGGPASPGRGHALKGMVWVANRDTKHKTRIKADELAAYEAKGYIKAGPRTQV